MLKIALTLSTIIALRMCFQWTMLSDLFVAFLGAFAGFMLTLCIENKKKKNFRIKKIEYFKTILQSFIEKAEKQTKNIQEFLADETINSTNFSCIKQVSMNDMNRLKNIDNQQLFESFYDRFGKQLNSTIDVYSEITRSIDFLESLLCFEFPRLENLNAKDCYELQKHAKTNIENAFWLISAYNRTNNDNPHKEMFNKWIWKYNNFIEGKSNDLLLLEKTILAPFLEEICETSLLNDFNFQQTLLLLKGAQTILKNELPYTFEEHRENLKQICQYAEKSIEILKNQKL